MNPLRWRKTTWALNVWNVLFGALFIAGIVDPASKRCPPGDVVCTSASNVGTGMGLTFLIFLWFLGFVVLSLVWLVRRRRAEPD